MRWFRSNEPNAATNSYLDHGRATIVTSCCKPGRPPRRRGLAGFAKTGRRTVYPFGTYVKKEISRPHVPVVSGTPVAPETLTNQNVASEMVLVWIKASHETFRYMTLSEPHGHVVMKSRKLMSYVVRDPLRNFKH